jgi:PAS domain-containing protein
LRATEAKYRNLVERLPVAVYLETLEEGQPTFYLGPAMEKMLGYPSSCWLEQPDFWLSIIHPDDVARVNEEHRKLLDSGDRLTTEYRMIARDVPFRAVSRWPLAGGSWLVTSR